MSRCSVQEMVNKISYQKLDNTVEVHFAILDDILSCVEINAKNYRDIIGNNAYFKKTTVPKDEFNCRPKGCFNTGTLMVTGDADELVGMTYTKKFDALDYAAGIVAYYAYFTEAGTYDVSVNIADITSNTNADAYTQTVVVDKAGHYPIIADLSKMPTVVLGSGWEPSNLGVNISFQIKNRDTSKVMNVGISTVQFFESIEDLQSNETVILGCLDDFTGDFTVDATDASCFGGGYDPDSVTIDRTINAGLATPNVWKLNPLMKRGKEEFGWMMETSTGEEVEKIEIDGVVYGVVQKSDYYDGECAFVYASLTDSCNVTDSIINRVSSPVAVALNENQFILQDGKVGDPTTAGRFLFHESLIGEKVTISYPKEYENAESFEGTDEVLAERRVMMSFIKKTTEGFAEHYIYENVFITSLSDTVTKTDEYRYSLNISVRRDDKRRFFRMYRIATK